MADGRNTLLFKDGLNNKIPPDFVTSLSYRWCLQTPIIGH